MKRVFALALCMMFLLGAAMAEADLRFETVGKATNGDIIRRCVLPSGQPVYFTAMDEAGHHEWADVNFDGHEDLVIHVASGASNRYSEFFVFDPETGWFHQVEHIGLDGGFGNYALIDGYVVSHSNNGAAGLLHETHIFRWEDGQLRLVRQAVAKERSDWDVAGEGQVSITYLDEVEMYILDFTMGTAGGETIWAKTVRKGDGRETDLEEEKAALWQGL